MIATFRLRRSRTSGNDAVKVMNILGGAVLSKLLFYTWLDLCWYLGICDPDWWCRDIPSIVFNSLRRVFIGVVGYMCYHLYAFRFDVNENVNSNWKTKKSLPVYFPHKSKIHFHQKRSNDSLRPTLIPNSFLYPILISLNKGFVFCVLLRSSLEAEAVLSVNLF